MTVEEMIAWLQSLKVPQAQVKAWCPEDQAWVPVTGAVFDDGELLLQTDDPS